MSGNAYARAKSGAIHPWADSVARIGSEISTPTAARSFQPDLFPETAPYPYQPGFRSAGGSRAAAEIVKPIVGKLHRLCLGVLEDAVSDLTDDEVAKGIADFDRHTVRSRMSELRFIGTVVWFGTKPVKISTRIIRVGTSVLRSRLAHFQAMSPAP
jgi:hypothetical protein